MPNYFSAVFRWIAGVKDGRFNGKSVKRRENVKGDFDEKYHPFPRAFNVFSENRN